MLVATVLAGLGAWTVHVLLARRPIAAKGPADGCPPSVLSLACQGRHPVADITPSGRITAAPTEREVELQQGSHRARNNPLLISHPWEHAMRKAVMAAGLILGLFFIVRAVAEPFVIDLSDPATYRNDWGGPSRGCGRGLRCTAHWSRS